MKEEMMNDAIDDVIGDEEDDEERFVVHVLFNLRNKLFLQHHGGACGYFDS